VRRRLVEVATRDFLSYSESLISTGQVARDPRDRGSVFGGFNIKKNLHRGFVIREIPTVTW
jgi:hypothetical protein